MFSQPSFQGWIALCETKGRTKHWAGRRNAWQEYPQKPDAQKNKTKDQQSRLYYLLSPYAQPRLGEVRANPNDSRLCFD
jgi:hypothetical protein